MWKLLLGLSLLVSQACRAAERGSSHPNQSTHRTGAQEQSGTLTGAESTELAADARAARLLRAVLENPSEANARDGLARLYDEVGFPGAAAFFRDSLTLLRNGTIPSEHPELPAGWEVAEPERIGEIYARAKEISELSKASRYSEAVAAAQDELPAYGFTSRIGAEWAYAVLGLAATSRTAVEDADLELALRILLTGLDGRLPQPQVTELPFGGSAWAYEQLANFFAALGDKVSAATAAYLGLLQLEEPPGEWAAWLEPLKERLRKRLLDSGSSVQEPSTRGS